MIKQLVYFFPEQGEIKILLLNRMNEKVFMKVAVLYLEVI